MTSAVVPVKGLASSKSRLLPYLGRDAVERLAIAMLGDVVAALREVPTLSRVAVVTPDARVAKAAEQVGAEPLLRRYADLNAALDGSAEDLAGRDDDSVLVVLGDVAGVRATELERLVAAVPAGGVALAPSSDGGTSALMRRPWNAIEASFGPGSAAVHRERARQRSLAFVELALPSLAIDIDEPADIEAALAGGSPGAGPRTRAVLESLP